VACWLRLRQGVQNEFADHGPKTYKIVKRPLVVFPREVP